MIAASVGSSLGMLVVQAAATALTALATPAPTAAANAGLPGSTWAGQCPPIQIGTYTFTFGHHRVHISYPRGRAPRSVPYTVTSTKAHGDVLTLNTTPAWQGSFTVDRKILDWVFQVGHTTRYGHCHLVRQHHTHTPA